MIKPKPNSLINVECNYHIMLDIETLGVHSGSAVWQIGMVGASESTLLLNTSEYFPEVDVTDWASTIFYETVKVPAPEEFEDIAHMDPGVDLTTLQWQMQHNKENYLKAVDLPEDFHEENMLQSFLWSAENAVRYAKEELKVDNIVWWSKSVRFDFPILEAALDYFELTNGTRYPWRYWELQEFRTAMYLAGISGKEQGRVNTHDALTDACNQFVLLGKALHKVRRLVDEDISAA